MLLGRRESTSDFVGSEKSLPPELLEWLKCPFHFWHRWKRVSASSSRHNSHDLQAWHQPHQHKTSSNLLTTLKQMYSKRVSSWQPSRGDPWKKLALWHSLNHMAKRLINDATSLHIIEHTRLLRGFLSPRGLWAAGKKCWREKRRWLVELPPGVGSPPVPVSSCQFKKKMGLFAVRLLQTSAGCRFLLHDVKKGFFLSRSVLMSDRISGHFACRRLVVQQNWAVIKRFST